DTAGNGDYNSYVTTELYLDTTSPSSPTGLAADPVSWTNKDSFDLSWSNPADISGIAGAYYKLDFAPTTHTDGTYVAGADIESITGISVVTDGAHTVYIWLNDTAGNGDYNSYVTVQLYLDLAADPVSWTNVDSFDLSWSNPADISGIVGVYYKLNDAPTTHTDGTYVGGADIESITGITVTSDGVHTVYIWLNDTAGNGDHTSYITTELYLDTTSPSSPLDLLATPDSWTNLNSFDLFWTNPVDLSGIVGVYYKLEAAPLTDTDGIYIAGTDIESILGILLSSDGVHDVYIWLNDSVGNIDRTNFANTQLYLDTTNPILIINNPTNNSYSNVPPSINITVYELNFISLTYTVIGHPLINNWLDNNTEVTLKTDIWDDLFEGEYQVIFTCFDIFGEAHRNDLTITLYKDTMAPLVGINLPLNNTYWNTAPYLNISATDPNLDSIWYSANNVNITLQNNELQLLNISIWNALPDEGEFEVQIYANDTFGHLNDKYILILHKDVVFPTLLINSPSNNTYHKLAPFINVTVLDPYFDSLWYQVGAQEVELINNTSQQLLSSIWDSISEEGAFIIYFFANDSAGNLNDLFKLDLNKDVRDPVITIINPDHNDLFGDIVPEFKLIISELNLNQTWYMLYNQTWNSLNYSFTGLAGKINQVAWNKFFNGNITIRFYANDTLNNLDYNETTIRKNLDSPIITIMNPPDNFLFGIEAPNITLYKSGLELNTSWYTLDYGVTNFTFSGNDTIIDQTAWSNYGFADVTISFYINDSLGKIGSDTIILRKDPDPPEVSITFITPLFNNSHCAAEPTFRITVYEPNLEFIWYRVGSTNITIFHVAIIDLNNTDIVLNDTIWNNLSQGKFTIEVFAIDELGYLNDSITLTFYKDTLPPILIINQPDEFKSYNAQPPINVTVYDSNFVLLSLTYTVVGIPHVPITLENNTVELLDQTIWNSLPQGEFQVSITAKDIFDHNAFILLTLYKDTLAPVFNSIIPSNFTYYKSSPNLTISYFDLNLDTIYYKIDTSVISLFDNIETPFNSSIWDGLSEGPFTIEFYATDIFGNTSKSTYLTLIKDTAIPIFPIISPLNNTYYNDRPTLIIVASDIN
ncbi:MAG: hypothetical protein ACTSSH_07360, partial [Candidatus Heimdallarchaeota archaeon]